MGKPSLWERIAASSNLVLAYRKARRGKMGKEDVLRYSRSLRDNLRILQQSLRDGSWRPGPFHVFTVYEPKERLISAAPFRDRVAHHALMNIVAPILDKRQIFHSYACREGKGVHACVAQAYQNQRSYSYFLRMDIRHFFPTIDHGVLLAKLQREIWDPST